MAAIVLKNQATANLKERQFEQQNLDREERRQERRAVMENKEKRAKQRAERSSEFLLLKKLEVEGKAATEEHKRLQDKIDFMFKLQAQYASANNEEGAAKAGREADMLVEKLLAL
jgi:hypothetical protein